MINNFPLINFNKNQNQQKLTFKSNQVSKPSPNTKVNDIGFYKNNYDNSRYSLNTTLQSLNFKKLTFKSNETPLIPPYTKANAQDYYLGESGKAFFNATVKSIASSTHYPILLKYIPEGGHIIDAGCGSGRDSKLFMEKGYKVTAFDRSPDLVKLASEHTGLKVIDTTFSEFKSKEKADGIWALNSLLVHVPPDELEKSIVNLTNHLKPGGVLLANLNIKRSYDKTELDRKVELFNKRMKELQNITAKHQDIKIVESFDAKKEIKPNEAPFLYVVIQKNK